MSDIPPNLFVKTQEVAIITEFAGIRQDCIPRELYGIVRLHLLTACLKMVIEADACADLLFQTVPRLKTMRHTKISRLFQRIVMYVDTVVPHNYQGVHTPDSIRDLH